MEKIRGNSSVGKYVTSKWNFDGEYEKENQVVHYDM